MLRLPHNCRPLLPRVLRTTSAKPCKHWFFRHLHYRAPCRTQPHGLAAHFIAAILFSYGKFVLIGLSYAGKTSGTALPIGKLAQFS